MSVISEEQTVRTVVNQLVGSCGKIDEPVRVKLVRRNSQGAVVEMAIIPISYFDGFGNICIEESSIQWQPYHSFGNICIKEYQ